MLANYLMARAVEVKIEKLATPLKAMIDTLIQNFLSTWRDRDEYLSGGLKGEVIPGIGVSGRVLMQTLGTDWGRDMVGEDVWVNCLLHRLKYDTLASLSAEVYIVTDVRFDNEAAICDYVIEVERPNHDTDVPEHASEEGVSDEYIDETLVNDSSLEAMADWAHFAVRDFIEMLEEHGGREDT
jgi:hypothetical protein